MGVNNNPVLTGNPFTSQPVAPPSGDIRNDLLEHVRRSTGNPNFGKAPEPIATYAEPPATYQDPPETYEVPPTYDDPTGENFNSFFDQRAKPAQPGSKPIQPVGAFSQPRLTTQTLPAQPRPVQQPTGIFAGAQQFQKPMNHATPRHPFMPTQTNHMFQSQPVGINQMTHMRPNQPVFNAQQQNMAQPRPAYLTPSQLPMPLQGWLEHRRYKYLLAIKVIIII